MLLVRVEPSYGQTNMKDALSAKMSEYLAAIKHESLDVQKEECDFMIASCADSLVRHHVANTIYEHYRDSKIMGAEGVAVHVFDKWFLSGKVKMNTEMEMFAAKIFAEFNRRSLIGQTAPELTMQTPNMESVLLFGETGKGRGYTVLYFYDTDCATCKVQTVLLRRMLEQEDFPIDLVAVYAADDYESWIKYIETNFQMQVKNTKVRHLWDPELTSDFQRKYGVTQTPRMFLISPDGVVLGRGLDTQAVDLMLKDIFAQKDLVYGSMDSEALFDGIFAMYDGKPGTAQVMGIADYIADKTLPSRDTVAFRQLAGDYLYYLSTRTGEGFKEGLRYHIDKNILSQHSVWKSKDDSLKVVGFAQIMSDLLSKSAPGTKVASLKVPGELLKARGTKKVRRKLNKLPGKENVIIFYTVGCDICAAEKDAAAGLVSGIRTGASDKVSDIGTSGDLSVFMVNVDDIMAADPSLASRLMETFDLSSLPYIIITDSKGVVMRRYVSLQ